MEKNGPFRKIENLWCLMVSIPDLCPFSYYNIRKQQNLENGPFGNREILQYKKTADLFLFSCPLAPATRVKDRIQMTENQDDYGKQ